MEEKDPNQILKKEKINALKNKLAEKKPEFRIYNSPKNFQEVRLFFF